jgi:3-dehydrosphinganine reductase
VTAFRGRRALVTGGSSGIGRATARALAAAGAHVVLAARGAERLREAAEDVRGAAAADVHVSWVSVDVADGRAVEAAGAEAVARMGHVDLVINAAGITRPGYVQELSEDDFRATMETNYFGAVHVTRALLPHLRARRGGHVSFVSSVAGFLGVFGYTAYAASKFALGGFAECLRQEVGPQGIGVSVLYPPDTDTPQLREEIPLRPRETAAVAGGLKVATAEEVARAYLRGLARGQHRIMPGLGTRLTFYAQRYAPGLVHAVLRRQIARAAAR